MRYGLLFLITAFFFQKTVKTVKIDMDIEGKKIPDDAHSRSMAVYRDVGI